MTFAFSVRYDGRDAAEHRMDMRLLGRSMVGLDRTIHQLLFVASERRLATARERLPISIQVAAPAAACVEVQGIIQALAGVLPFAYEALSTVGTDFIFHAISYVLNTLGGKPKEAEPHFTEMVRLHKEMMEAARHDAQTARAEIYANEAEWRNFALTLVDRLTKPAKEIVGPVGPSCNSVTIQPPRRSKWSPTVVDAPMADVIRAEHGLIVGEMVRIRLKIDGVIKHSRSLKVEDPQHPGRYIAADVRDPAFDVTPNVYTEALETGGYLNVDAKPTLRTSGELVKLYVMNAAADG